MSIFWNAGANTTGQKKLVNQNIRAVNFQTLKEELISDFMKNQRTWADYDPKRPTTSPRRQFDTIISKSSFALNTLTLTQYFADCVTDPGAEAERMIKQLIGRADPRYNQSGNRLGRELKNQSDGPFSALRRKSGTEGEL